MKIKICAFGILLLWPVMFALAQPTTLPERLSLEKAIELALGNNAELNMRAYTLEKEEERIQEARFRLLPVVSGNFEWRRNLIIPSTPVPANAFNPSAPASEINAVRFGTNRTANTGLNVSYPILNKRTKGDIREKTEGKKLAAIERELSETELRKEVSLAYAECLLAKAQIELAGADTLNSRIALAVILDRYANGRAPLTELNQARIEWNNAQSRLTESHRIYALACARLLHYLGYPDSEMEITFTDDLAGLFARFQPEEVTPFDFAQTLTGAQYRQQVLLSEIQLANAGLDYRPTLSLNGFLGASYFNNALNPLNTGYWFGSSFLALTLNIPITDRIGNERRLAQLRYQVLSDQENLRAGREQRMYQIRQAQTDLYFYQADLTRKQENLRLTEENYQSLLQQYQEGRATANALSLADLQTENARVDYLQVYYDCLRTAIMLYHLKRYWPGQ